MTSFIQMARCPRFGLKVDQLKRSEIQNRWTTAFPRTRQRPIALPPEYIEVRRFIQLGTANPPSIGSKSDMSEFRVLEKTGPVARRSEQGKSGCGRFRTADFSQVRRQGARLEPV